MSKLLNRALRKFENSNSTTKIKARLILLICLLFIFIIPFIILSSAYQHLHSEAFNYHLNFQILLPEIIMFIIVLIISLFLMRGYFTVPAHLLLIMLFTSIWTVMTFDVSSVLSRLDTIVYIIGILVLTPLAVIRNGYVIILYGVINIAVFFAFTFFFRHWLNLPKSDFIIYLMDNTIVMFFVTITSFFIFSINRNAIERAEKALAKKTLAEEKTIASLKEKEAMLQEIHHRVKNNLQIIISLINLQKIGNKDSKLIKEFNDITSRIRAMAIVHENLYNSESLSQIDFASYIKTVAEELFSSYRHAIQKPKLHIDVEGIHLGIEQAIPCGLIVNELISNALRYAFPAGNSSQEIKISISMHMETSGEMILTIRDNGIGLPESIDIGTSNTLGLKLVTLLVEQIRGNYKLERNMGTGWIITFPLLPEN